MIMKSEAAGRWGIGIIVGSLIACLAVNYSVGDQVKDEKETVTVALQDMGSKTEKCIQQDVRTDGPACQEAAAKAAEVKAAPEQTTVTVNVPRRTDAEVKQLIADAIREDPSLVPKAKDGKDAVLTDEDYQRIADIVQGRVKNGTDGKDGADAVVDYDKIVAAVLAKLPPPVDGKDGTTPACLSEPAQCRGETGATGEAGRGIVSHDYRIVDRDGIPTCVEHNEYTKDPTVQEFTVNPALCTG